MKRSIKNYFKRLDDEDRVVQYVLSMILLAFVLGTISIGAVAGIVLLIAKFPWVLFVFLAIFLGMGIIISNLD